MPAWKCSGCGALTMVPEDPTTHLPNCPNMEALRKRKKLDPEPVLTSEPDNTVSPIDAGVVVAEALTEILTDSDSDPEPDSPADTPFDGFDGGETGGGGAGGDF